jgi:kumamolisin
MSARRELPGSDCGEPDRAARIGDVDPARPLALSLHLRDPDAAAPSPGSAADLAALARPLTRKQLADRRRRRFGEAGRKIAAFAAAAGLDVVDINLPRRRIRLAGSAEQAARAFDTRLALYERDGRDFHARSGMLSLPEAIAPWVESVLGLDGRTKVRRATPHVADADTGAGGPDGLWPSTMAQLYGIASEEGAAGQCIGVVELAGGYAAGDLAAAAQRMDVALPKVTDVGIAGGANAFGQGTSADREVALDLQVVAGAAPGAAIAVYFAPWEKFADAVLDAVHDNRRKPTVLSISWGVAESAWMPDELAIMNRALRDAAQLGITVTAAAGDALATDGQFGARAHVDFPASSPYVLGCGGTRITLAPDGRSIADEVVWNDGTSGTGGGISDRFDVPDFQAALALPASANGDGRKGRGVPDLAAAAARVNGYRTIVAGAEAVQPGTSAVAPLMAALIALANARRGKPLGLINPFLYANASLFRPVTQGNNINRGVGYQAGPGWNACCGLGAPKGDMILAALTAVA